MIEILSQTWWIDVVLVLTVMELLGLLAWRWFTRRGPAVPAFVGQLLAGLCLMLALRAAVADAPMMWVLAWLAGAGVAHAWDIWWRWVYLERRADEARLRGGPADSRTTSSTSISN